MEGVRGSFGEEHKEGRSKSSDEGAGERNQHIKVKKRW